MSVRRHLDDSGTAAPSLPMFILGAHSANVLFSRLHGNIAPLKNSSQAKGEIHNADVDHAVVRKAD
eukprot:SAG31_NODE_737_length_12474_cov_14.694303_5_plen_66_part_00